MNQHAGIHPQPSPWRQQHDRGQPERVSPWRDSDERVFLAAFWSWRLRHLPGQGTLRRVRAPASRALRRLGRADGERTRLPVEPGSGCSH